MPDVTQLWVMEQIKIPFKIVQDAMTMCYLINIMMGLHRLLALRNKDASLPLGTSRDFWGNMAFPWKIESQTLIGLAYPMKHTSSRMGLIIQVYFTFCNLYMQH